MQFIGSWVYSYYKLNVFTEVSQSSSTKNSFLAKYPHLLHIAPSPFASTIAENQLSKQKKTKYMNYLCFTTVCMLILTRFLSKYYLFIHRVICNVRFYCILQSSV